MTLSDAQERVLAELVARIPEDVQWCVFGSTDTVLRGLEDDPADVDVLTTAAGAEGIRSEFADSYADTREVGRSRIDEYRILGEEIEVVHADPGTNHGEPLVDLEAVDLERTPDRDVPLLPLDVLLDLYRRIDKHGTADRLAARLDASG